MFTLYIKCWKAPLWDQPGREPAAAAGAWASAAARGRALARADNFTGVAFSVRACQAPPMRVSRRARMLSGVLAAGLALALPSGAIASLRASTSLQTGGGSTRLVVKLSSTTRLTGGHRPRSVTVKAGRTTYRLSRASAAQAAAVSLGTWRSAALTGGRAAALLALQGSRVSVTVLSADGGRSTTTSMVARLQATPPTTPPPPGPPPPAPGPPPPPAPLFAPPGHVLTGMEAFNSFSRYFLNSEFSDCAGGRWPSCAVESRYEHGPEGSWEYHRCTPVSGSDINSYRSDLKVTGAEQAADGSWKIEYTENEGLGFYHWEVSTTGAVNGYYSFNGGAPEQLVGFIWRQPSHLGDCYS